MLIESLVKVTVELQGFRVVSVTCRFWKLNLGADHADLVPSCGRGEQIRWQDTFSDLRFDQLFAMGLKRGQGARLIFPDETAVADHVGGQYGGEAAFLPQTTRVGGWWARKYACHAGYKSGLELWS